MSLKKISKIKIEKQMRGVFLVNRMCSTRWKQKKFKIRMSLEFCTKRTLYRLNFLLKTLKTLKNAKNAKAQKTLNNFLYFILILLPASDAPRPC